MRRLLVAVVLVSAFGCTPGESGSTAPTTGTPAPPASAISPQQARDVLAGLRIEDRPHVDGYRRDQWPLWKDIDGDGCDARDQALIAASRTPPKLDGPCHVAAGDWLSLYDGVRTEDPRQLDIDHVVPLENAHQSGGWQWSTDRRAQYANDQADLWVVSAASNRSKGARAPNEWRPPFEPVWCEYATRWVEIKKRWDLSATTAERDALGQMLDSCTAGAGLPDPRMPNPAPNGTPQTVFFGNCAAARAAGKAPLHRGDPGYREDMDGDHDGVACE